MTDLKPCPTVRVKPLEWKQYVTDSWWPIGVGLILDASDYKIIRSTRGVHEFSWFFRGEWFSAPSLEAAQAAAQADYERRILSVIEVIDRDAILEEAAKVADAHQHNHSNGSEWASGEIYASTTIAAAIRPMKGGEG
tara:strand:+ start:3135 stop:3545 length:411 start_codon:yes stop_codon:yes gene_type:complete